MSKEQRYTKLILWRKGEPELGLDCTKGLVLSFLNEFTNDEYEIHIDPTGNLEKDVKHLISELFEILEGGIL